MLEYGRVRIRMIANYHTHTYRCGHAVGSEREYVEAAMRAGLRTLGISDHTPYDFFDSAPRNRPMRMKPEELPEYAQSVRTLAAEMSGRIEILLGVEAEYYPKYFRRTLSLLHDNGVEYMILGQHFLGNEIDAPYSGLKSDREEVLTSYVDQCIEALGTGLFTYFAHPDLVHFTGGDEVYTRHIRRLCRAARETGTPLEINLLGMREGRHYPTERFWQIAAEEGNAVILGCDAHSPEQLLSPEYEQSALELIRRLGLKLLDRAEIRRI